MLSIFLPNRIGNNFIIKKTMLIIYIRSKSIYACLVEIKGKVRKVTKTAKVIFDVRDENDLDILFSNTINKMINGWKFDYSKLIISGNEAIFKILNFPFYDEEKLKMIAPFEIEQMLPFSLSDCSIDTILVSKLDKKIIQEKYIALASIVKQETLSFYRDVYSRSDLKLNCISIDLVEFIADHLNKKWENDHFILLKEENTITLLVYKKNNIVSLKLMETEFKENTEYYFEELEKEDKNIDKSVSNSTELIKLKEEKETDSLKDKFEESNLKNNISSIYFNIGEMIKNFEKKYFIKKEEAKLYIFGFDSSNNNLINLISKNTGYNIEKYTIEDEKNDIKIKYDDKNNFFNDSAADILKIVIKYDDKISNFNLGHEEEMSYSKNILYNQVFSAIFLSLFLIFITIGWNYYKINLYKKNIKKVEKESIDYLKKEFKLTPKSTVSLEKAIKDSDDIINNLVNNLPGPAKNNKFEFLENLKIISMYLSRDIKGLNIKQIRWKGEALGKSETISIYGSVSDFDSLKLLEDGLKNCGLFINIPQSQFLDFKFDNLSIIKKD